MQNNNPFNNPNNPMHKMQSIMPKSTPRLLKHISSIVCGITPMMFAIFLIGPEGSEFINWKNPDDFRFTIQYGAMWGVGIGLIFMSAILSMIVSSVSKEINRDIIPFAIAWAFSMFGFFIIPLVGPWKIFFILIFPLLWIFGMMIGGIGVIIFTMSKLNKDMKQLQEDDPEVKKQMEEMMKGMNSQYQGKFRNQSPNHNKNSPVDDKNNSSVNDDANKTEYEDNPFVDVKPDDEE